MPKVETEIEIGAAPEEVWKVLMDPRRLGDWVTIQSGLGDVPDRELRDGDSFEQTLSLAGAKFDVNWTVSGIEKPRAAEWTARGPGGSGARVRYGLEPGDGETTRFTYFNDYDLPGGGVGAVAGKLSSRVTKRAMNSSLRRLRKLVEA